MAILIIAATEMEIAPFLKKNPTAEYLITGVGAPIATYHLLKKVQQQPYDFVIQLGIAGSFHTNIALGESVIVVKDCFADLGVVEKKTFNNVFDMGLVNSNEFSFESGWLENKSISTLNSSFKKVKAITVNTITDDADCNDRFQKKYHADIETMEGAALHYVCLQEKIPFLQIRGISNYVGERDKMNWKITEAIASSTAALLDVYELISAK
jgi:futalosine hydrolase